MAGALLHVIELPHQITRRSSGETRHRSEPFQIRPMAEPALSGFAGARRYERFSLLDASWWHIHNESGMRIAKDLGLLGVFGRLDDPRSQRLFLVTLERQIHAARE